jgi:hypothetical protein
MSKHIVKILSFKDLEEDWNGKGAFKPTENTINRALGLVGFVYSTYFLEPKVCNLLPSGGIQLNYLLDLYSVEVEICSNYTYAIYVIGEETKSYAMLNADELELKIQEIFSQT